MRGFLIALMIGLTFGLGLSFGGMSNPQTVLAFLDITGAWNPNLIVLMATAVAVTFVLYRAAHRMKKPLFADAFSWPKMTRVDLNVTLGPAIFGIGWGIGGICPGPAFQLPVTNGQAALWFLPFLAIGFWIGRPHHRRARAQAEAEHLAAMSNSGSPATAK